MFPQTANALPARSKSCAPYSTVSGSLSLKYTWTALYRSDAGFFAPHPPHFFHSVIVTPGTMSTLHEKQQSELPSPASATPRQGSVEEGTLVDRSSVDKKKRSDGKIELTDEDVWDTHLGYVWPWWKKWGILSYVALILDRQFQR